MIVSTAQGTLCNHLTKGILAVRHRLSIVCRPLDHLFNRFSAILAVFRIEPVNAYCGEALLGLFSYLPLLGFILRSTNVRNAFEVYGPEALARARRYGMTVCACAASLGKCQTFAMFIYTSLGLPRASIHSALSVYSHKPPSLHFPSASQIKTHLRSL